jgi:hypothetical protein
MSGANQLAIIIGAVVGVLATNDRNYALID